MISSSSLSLLLRLLQFVQKVRFQWASKAGLFSHGTDYPTAHTRKQTHALSFQIHAPFAVKHMHVFYRPTLSSQATTELTADCHPTFLSLTRQTSLAECNFANRKDFLRLSLSLRPIRALSSLSLALSQSLSSPLTLFLLVSFSQSVFMKECTKN